jgi:dienelactone hydrolase
LEGIHVFDDAVVGKRPAILVVHQWTGLSDNEKRRSRLLAELGYNGAVHAFTQKEAGDDNSKGAAYNEPADRRSWTATQAFFAELFK